MNKQDIIQELSKWNFPTDRYAVISSGSLVMHGLKNEANDVDIACTDDLCRIVAENENCIVYGAGEDGHPCYQVGNLEASMWFYHPDKVDVIEGIPCQSLEDVLELKLFLNRDKDQFDIALLRKYLDKK